MAKSRPEKTPASTVRSPDILPEQYGTNRLMLFPVEPGKVHVYWEFVFQQGSFSGKDRSNMPFAGDDKHRTKAVLRFYDAAGSDSNLYFDQEVDTCCGSCYVDILRPGGAYVAEFGFRAATGDFFPAIRSNVIETPPLVPTAEVRSVPETTPETVAKENDIADLAFESDEAPEATTPNRKDVQAQQKGKLAAVSASANIQYLSSAFKMGSGREEIRATMDRLWRLGLRPYNVQPTPLKSRPLDLTELCEQHFLFGNSSK